MTFFILSVKFRRFININNQIQGEEKMNYKLFKKTEDGNFSIVVWSTEEMNNQESFICDLWQRDIEATSKELIIDEQFKKLTQGFSEEDIKLLIELTLCYYQRNQVKLYGYGHR